MKRKERRSVERRISVRAHSSLAPKQIHSLLTESHSVTEAGTVPVLSASSCSKPFIILVAIHWTRSCMSMSLFYWRAQNQTQHARCVSPVLSRGKGSPPSTCWQCSTPHAAQDAVGLLCCKGTLLAHGQLVTKKVP